MLSAHIRAESGFTKRGASEGGRADTINRNTLDAEDCNILSAATVYRLLQLINVQPIAESWWLENLLWLTYDQQGRCQKRLWVFWLSVLFRFHLLNKLKKNTMQSHLILKHLRKVCSPSLWWLCGGVCVFPIADRPQTKTLSIHQSQRGRSWGEIHSIKGIICPSILLRSKNLGCR